LTIHAKTGLSEKDEKVFDNTVPDERPDAGSGSYHHAFGTGCRHPVLL